VRPGAELFNLKDDGAPASLGEVGELHVGGIGLARGYLNRPDLTKEKFIVRSLQRLYRTGDFVRERTKDVFEFVGRADRQVKVRGFRIELDEIESCLANHPQVSSCAVRVWEREGAHGQLAGYYTAIDQIEAEQVRAFLVEQLPASMVPSHLIPMDKLPQAVSGKVDYQELPDPLFPPRDEKVQTGEITENDLESRLTEIWEEVLGLEVAREDHFIELGGDSLLSVQVAVQGQAAGLEFTSAEVLAYPTVAKLAQLLESRS
ncbi:MAG: non-ribosomal peptide synthetase, partial [Lacipirellulaceae bacterium]